MVFRNNDLPGVMLASAAQRLMRLWGVAPGPAGGRGHRQPAGLRRGPRSARRRRRPPGRARPARRARHLVPARDELIGRGVRVRDGWTVVEALPGRAGTAAGGCHDRPGHRRGHARPAQAAAVACDLVVTSVGRGAPGPARLRRRCALRLRRRAGDASASRPRRTASSSPVRSTSGTACRVSRRWRRRRRRRRRRAGLPDRRARMPRATPGRSSRTPSGKDFVDFDEDQTVGDLLNAMADGFDDPELAKRYTTTAMGPSQGRHSALNALRIVRRASPLGAEAVGVTTTQRPPFLPESFAPPGRPRLRARPADRHAPPAPGARRAHDAGGPVVPARLLRHARPARGRHRRRGARRARGRGHDRRQHAGRLEVRGPDAAELPGADLHLRLRQAAGRPHPLPARLRHDRCHHRRRRRLPLRRGLVLRHRHHLGRRRALPLHAALERRVAARRRRRQRHGRLCRRSTSRAPSPGRSWSGWTATSTSRPRPSPTSPAARARWPASPSGCCA